MRPLIAIVGYSDEAHWNVWNMQAVVVGQPYIDHVAVAGGQPVILPPSAVDASVLAAVHGLLLIAGPDVDPGLYGAAPHPETELRPGRDECELALAHAARERDIPVLGICRGIQILAVAYGGSLHQHLPAVENTQPHLGSDCEMVFHDVTFAPGSVAAQLCGQRARVNSHHHQAVADPGALEVMGRADDGVIEAVEDKGSRHVVGVQWHPELEPSAWFAQLVSASRDYMATRETAMSGDRG